MGRDPKVVQVEKRLEEYLLGQILRTLSACAVADQIALNIVCIVFIELLKQGCIFVMLVTNVQREPRFHR